MGLQADIDELLTPPAGDAPVTYLQLRVPPELKETVSRHHANLLQLYAALKDAELTEQVIVQKVESAVESYRAVLRTAIDAIG
jgi:hypothetical protein